MSSVGKPFAAAALIAIFGASSCVSDDELPDDLDLDDADFVDEESNNPACATGASRDATTDPGCDLQAGDICSHITADGSYGNDWTSGESCQAYINLGVPTDGEPSGETMVIEYFAAAYTLPTNQADCENTYVELDGYYYDEIGGGQYRHAGNIKKWAWWSGGSCHQDFARVGETLNCNGFACERSPVVSARAVTDTGTCCGLPTVRRVYLGVHRTDI